MWKENPEVETRSIRQPEPPKKALGVDELKTLVESRYKESTAISKIAEEIVDKVTHEYGKQLFELMALLDDALGLEVREDQYGRRKYEMKSVLTDEELEFLVVKIPTVCLYIQEQINRQALDATIAEYIKEDTVTEKLKTVTARDAKERLRFAEQQAEVESIVHMIKSQIYLNLKTLVERADRVYEGLKKLIDGRNHDKFLSRRASMFTP